MRAPCTELRPLGQLLLVKKETPGSRSSVSQGLSVRCCAPLCLAPALKILPNILCLLNSSVSLKGECDRLEIHCSKKFRNRNEQKWSCQLRLLYQQRPNDKCAGTDLTSHLLAWQMLLETVQYSIRKSSPATRVSHCTVRKISLLPIHWAVLVCRAGHLAISSLVCFHESAKLK